MKSRKTENQIKVLAVANNKGGVSKTTLTKIMGEGLAFLHGKRVLLIDADPQCNLTECFLPLRSHPSGLVPPVHPNFQMGDPEWVNDYSSLADIFLVGGAEWYPTQIGGISIVAGDSGRLESLAVNSAVNTDGIDRLSLLGRWIREIVVPEQLFDIILIDTPPNRGPLTQAVIRASTHILVPSMMDKFSLTGLKGMFSLIQEQNSNLEIIGLLPTQFQNQSNQNRAFLDAIQQTEELGRYLMSTVMHTWSGYRSSAMHGWEYSVFARQPKDKVRQEAQEIVLAIKERLYG